MREPVEAMGPIRRLKGDIYKRCCFFGSPDDGFGCLELWNMFKGVVFFFLNVCAAALWLLETQDRADEPWEFNRFQPILTANSGHNLCIKEPPIHWFSYEVGWNLKLSNLGYRLSSSWASTWGSTSIFIVSLSFLLLLPLRNRLGHRGGGPSEMVAKRCRDTDVLERWGHLFLKWFHIWSWLNDV